MKTGKPLPGWCGSSFKGERQKGTQMNDDKIPVYAREVLERLYEQKPDMNLRMCIRKFGWAMANMKPSLDAYLALNEAVLSALHIGFRTGRSDPRTAAKFLSDLQRERVEKRHSAPGGSRDKKNQIRAIWATGKYSSRDICAEQECSALGMSFKAARNALQNTPKP